MTENKVIEQQKLANESANMTTAEHVKNQQIPDKPNTLRKTRNKNTAKKKAKHESIGEETQVQPNDAQTDTTKKKKYRRPKKKSVVNGNVDKPVDMETFDNKEVTAVQPSDTVTTSTTTTTTTTTTAVSSNEPKTAGTKKRSKKKKQKEAIPKTEEKTYTVDYEGLKDALKESFSLDDRLGPVHFAPLTGKMKRLNDVPSPKLSYSASPTMSYDYDGSLRVSNKSTPTAKNRHAQIPPPSSLMTGSKKKHGKEIGVPAESIENFKPKKPKASEEKTKPKLKKPKAPGSKIIIEEQPEVNEINKEEKEAVEKKKKKKKAEVSSTSSATKEKEYCHPNDAISPTRSNRPRFERYLDPKIYTKMVEKGELHEGILRVNRRSRTDAYVTCENLGGDIFINGQHDRNRALDGDTVIVQLLDLETIWAKKKEQMIQKREERHKTALERPPRDEGEDDKAKPKYVGKVVAISNTSKLQTCSGTLSVHRHSSQDEQSLKADGEDENGPTESDGQKQIKIVWFKPVDLRKPLMAIPIRHAPLDIIENPKKYTNLLMVAKITRWPIDSPHPLGSVLRELGHIGNIVAETQAVLEDNHIIEQPFGNKALKCLPQVPWSISQEEIDKRRDLRDYRIFTIDPATAKDLDDAVHIIKLGKDEFEVGVHIADVSHFVHQHTALDHEAFDRGTSTYLCDRVIPMLPSLLCEQLCSLNPAVERLAFSVIWKMDGAGNIKDTWFGKSVIKSCAKLAYEDAQQVIEGHGLPSTASVKSFAVSEVEQDIKYLFQLSKQMRERRFAGGALSINSIRLSFKLNELGEPCAVSIYEQKDANRLIEEFMLCANTSVAQKIASHYPNDALLRQHSPPHEKSLDEFIRIAEGMGYSFDGSSAGALQKSFNAIESEDVRAVLRLLAVKPMQRAKYFCTGSCDAAKYGHYALNIPLYTHFTSPIRRFADIIVHRQLEAALKNKQSCGYKKDAVTKVAIQCNERKEGAKNSQDMNIQLYLAHYLYMIETKTKKPVICTAIVTQILKDCFEVLISEYGIEKRIHMDALPIKKYVYDPRKHALSVYWQEGIEATREYDMNRKLDEDYREPSGTQLYLNQDSSDDNDESTATKTIYEIPQELLNDNLIDNEAKSQRFETFSKLQVRIQVNVERSPPIVNIYPVNPFM